MYLTPYALSDLVIWLLSGLSCLYLWGVLYRTRPDTPHFRHLFWLALTLSGITATYLVIFLTETLYPNGEFYLLPLNILFVVTTAGSLVQFFYHFPVLMAQRRRESRFFRGLMIGLGLAEALFAAYRYLELGQGRVVYRPAVADLGFMLFLLWVPLNSLRQLGLVDSRPLSIWRKVWYPAGQSAKTLRLFFLIAVSPIAVASVNIFRNYGFVEAMSAQSIYLAFSMTALLIATIAYLNDLPEQNSFMIRLLGINLTTILVALGVAALFLGGYVFAHYQPNGWPADYQTLHFTPNEQGGYDVGPLPYQWQPTVGQTVEPDQPLPLPFAFPFFGQHWDTLYPAADSRVAFGRPFSNHDAQFFYGSNPAIFALNLSLSGPLLASHSRQHLSLIWFDQQNPAVQVILYPSGHFEITFHQLPTPYPFDIYRRWRPSPLLAALPGRDSLAPAGIILHDYHRDYRLALHQASRPFAWLILLATATLLFGLPLIFRQNVIRPLNNLLAGLRQIEKGHYNLAIPAQFPDEIGYLTEAFNKMAAQLQNLIATLEERVEKRTAELLQQQRLLAAQEERRRLARDLHDSMTQSLHSLALSAKTAQYLLQKERYQALPSSLELLAESANQAYAEMRLLLYELQMTPDQEADLLQVLRHRLEQVEQRSGLNVTWQIAEIPQLPKEAEVTLFYIAMEALNNAIRHAAGRQIQLQIYQDGDWVCLRVKDDGRGLGTVPEPESGKLGMGLRNMSGRAAEIGGTLTIQSSPNQGTTLTALIPLYPFVEN